MNESNPVTAEQGPYKPVRSLSPQRLLSWYNSLQDCIWWEVLASAISGSALANTELRVFLRLAVDGAS